MASSSAHTAFPPTCPPSSCCHQSQLLTVTRPTHRVVFSTQCLVLSDTLVVWREVWLSLKSWEVVLLSASPLACPEAKGLDLT